MPHPSPSRIDDRVKPDHGRVSTRAVVLVLRYAPGLLLAIGVAAAAWLLEGALKGVSERLTGNTLVPPAAVLALLLGMFLRSWAQNPHLEAGRRLSASGLLRIAVALLGLRLSIADIVSIGGATAIAMVLTMAATMAMSGAIARVLGCSPGIAVLMGAANSVCGASATLAVAAVLPDSLRKQNEIVLTVVLANAISTLAMLAYPLLATRAGLSSMQSGILIGASVQDMAQVVGAVAGMSTGAINAAITVKMFRVLLLLPVVWLVSVWFERKGTTVGPVSARVPGFALAFVVLCAVNSVLTSIPTLTPYYEPVKRLLGLVSTSGLLVALAALGLETSLGGMTQLGWRPIVLFVIGALTILALALAMAAGLGV